MIAAARPTDNCNLESARLDRAATGEARLTLSGWISELGRQVTSPGGLVALRGPAATLAAPLKVDKPRPDVAAFYKNPTGRESGFTGTFYIRELPKGAYAVSVLRRAGPGWIVCVSKTPLAVP